MQQPGIRELVRAARSLARSPGHTFLALATLALGVGAVVGVFSVVDQVLLRPLPVHDQDRVVVAWGDDRVRDFSHFPVSWEALEAARETGAFAATAATDAWGLWERITEDEDGRETLAWARVLGDFSETLGLTPLAGRTLRGSDDVPGGPRVAVISEGLWERRYGRDPGAVGSVLRALDGSYTVVGVVPADFDYPRGAEVWTPTKPTQADAWTDSVPHMELDLLARLAPGVTVEEARSRVERAWREDPSLPRAYADVTPVMRTFADVVLGEMQPTLLTLLAGALLVLGVALLNLTNLVLVRASRRSGDLAVRRALGAGPWHLVRDSLTEGSVLGLLGVVAGAGLAWAGVRGLLPLAPVGLPRLARVGSPEPGSWLVAAGLTAAVVALVTAAPALLARRAHPADVLRGVDRGASSAGGWRRRGRRVLLAGQAALAVWVTAAGVLLLRSLLELQAIDPGFRTESLQVVELEVPYVRFQTPGDLPDRFARAAELLEARPGVVSATAALSRPLPGNAAWDVVARLEGQTMEEAMATLPFLSFEPVQPDYFHDLGLTMARGRAPGPEDRAGAPPVAVVNETAARRLWPGGEALGKRVNLGFPGVEETWWEVVGVARDARYRELLEPRPAIYVPFPQMAGVPPGYLLVRTSGAGVDLLPAVEEAFQEADPTIRVKGAVSVERVLAGPLVRPRFAVSLLGLFAAVILILAAAGVYGVMASLVRARTREMGVRLACGASPGGVGRLVLGQGLAVVAWGIMLGVGATFVSGSLLDSLLYQVTAADPVSVTAAAVLVLAVAASACAAPAVRAARVQVVEVLRGE